MNILKEGNFFKIPCFLGLITGVLTSFLIILGCRIKSEELAFVYILAVSFIPPGFLVWVMFKLWDGAGRKAEEKSKLAEIKPVMFSDMIPGPRIIRFPTGERSKNA